MAYRVNEPIFTHIFESVDYFCPEPNSLYITGNSSEVRSEHLKQWEANCTDVKFARVINQETPIINIDVESNILNINLRSMSQVRSVLQMEIYSQIYLDVTGLEHNVWAPFVRAIRMNTLPGQIIYVEPGDYSLNSNPPTEGMIFDLSERIQGISPLPGFANLSQSMSDECLFVPLLGFEGTRLAFMLEAIQPERPNIFPVVGVPGFRPEYPFYTYVGNKAQLSETRAWQNVRFAQANCPFSLYHILEDLTEEYPGYTFKIATIGTKPHAIGAVLYYLDHPNRVELVYDHPIRKGNRTTGISRVCIYDLSLLAPIRSSRPKWSRT